MVRMLRAHDDRPDRERGHIDHCDALLDRARHVRGFPVGREGDADLEARPTSDRLNDPVEGPSPIVRTSDNGINVANINDLSPECNIDIHIGSRWHAKFRRIRRPVRTGIGVVLRFEDRIASEDSRRQIITAAIAQRTSGVIRIADGILDEVVRVQPPDRYRRQRRRPRRNGSLGGSEVRNR